MSTYFKKGKGWRIDFTLHGQRHTLSWFKTKAEAKAGRGSKKGGIKKSAVGGDSGNPNRHGLLGTA